MPGKNAFGAYLKLCRPFQWTKNLIVFAPLLFAAKITEPELLLKVCGCLVSMCLLSSATYIFNDIVDRKADIINPIKKDRPLANGEAEIGVAAGLTVILLAASLVVAFFVRPALLLVALAYLTVMVLYNLKLKQWPVIDVICIACGFVLRAVGGAAAAHVPVSAWFLLCTSLGALFLALDKRRQEIVLMNEDAELHRKALSGYTEEVLTRIEGLVLPSLLTCYVFYSFQSYHGEAMLLTVPFVLFGLMRYQFLSATSTQTAAPDTVLLKDRPLQIAIVLWLLTAAIVVYDAWRTPMRSLIEQMDSLRLLY